jgi:CBS domain-containing protein
MTPMSAALTLSPTTPAADAAARLKREDFDQAPVVRRDAITGYALRRELAEASKGRVQSAMRRLNDRMLVSADATVSDLLHLLCEMHFAFVVDRAGIAGFVTPSDLNKHGARAHFYLMIAALEIGLSDLIRSRVKDQESLLSLLPVASVRAVRRRYDDDSSADTQVDYVASMEFSHLCRIVRQRDDLRQALGFSTKASWDKLAGGLPTLRNDVMHPTRPFFAENRPLDRLVEAEDHLRVLLGRLQALEAG